MSLFENRLAVVFGGGRDIGRAVSVDLARNGAQVAFSYYDGGYEETLAAIKEAGSTGWAFKVQAMDTTAVRAFAAEAREKAGKEIGVLINVVGGMVARKRMEEMDDAYWETVMNLNVRSLFAMTQAALPLMSNGGAIVNFASLAGRDGGGGGSIAYATAKGALMSFTRGLAKELGPRNIRANAVCPGMIATKFHDDFTKPEIRAKVAAATPLGREGKAEEVAQLVTYLASNNASFVNGSCVDINGGVFQS
ncbi:MAG TPA: SDR family oxidoreductase [Acidobacteriaceae bacterium]